MAPTETLAEQHFLTLEPLCAELGVRVRAAHGLASARRRSATTIASGDAQIAVGTHALIQRDVEFADLAVAVVDEQHRFGVEQRQALAEGRVAARAAHDRDADPAHARDDGLRRSRGDRDREAARRPQADRHGLGRRGALVGGVRAAARALDAGRQAYVVCPLIEQSETRLARAAEDEAERLQRAELTGYRVGLLHGRLEDRRSGAR